MLRQDGELRLLEGFLGEAEARALHRVLLESLAWAQEHITVCGRRVASPRLVGWYGDPGAVYRYSGVVHTPRPWTPALADLKARIERCTGAVFNSVLANLYRDGADSMGWHADNERELGPAPCIASLSLGATRTFRVRHNETRAAHDFELASGSLLVMAGSFQRHWRHCVPKTRKPTGSRINLTFRRILDA